MKAKREYKKTIVKKYRRGEVVRFILAYLKGSMTDDQRNEFDEWLGLDER